MMGSHSDARLVYPLDEVCLVRNKVPECTEIRLWPHRPTFGVANGQCTATSVGGYGETTKALERAVGLLYWQEHLRCQRPPVPPAAALGWAIGVQSYTNTEEQFTGRESSTLADDPGSSVNGREPRQSPGREWPLWLSRKKRLNQVEAVGAGRSS